MKKCTDKKLIEKAKQYFENDKDRKVIYVTPNGQFFNKISDSSAYCAFKNFSISTITDEMVSGKNIKIDKKTSKGTDKTKK